MLSTAGASKALRNPSERHVRQWYLLADLYERAGDVPKAREYFERVFRTDPEAYDVAERLRSLGPRSAAPDPGRRAQDVGSTKTARPPQRLVWPATLMRRRRRDGAGWRPAPSERRQRRRRRRGAGGAGGGTVVVVVGGGAVPKSGPTTVTRVPIGVRGQTRAALA